MSEELYSPGAPADAEFLTGKEHTRMGNDASIISGNSAQRGVNQVTDELRSSPKNGLAHLELCIANRDDITQSQRRGPMDQLAVNIGAVPAALIHDHIVVLLALNQSMIT
jgi:hypothetical protein